MRYSCYLCDTYLKLIEDFPNNVNYKIEFQRHKEISGHKPNGD